MVYDGQINNQIFRPLVLNQLDRLEIFSHCFRPLGQGSTRNSLYDSISTWQISDILLSFCFFFPRKYFVFDDDLVFYASFNIIYHKNPK